MKWKIINDDYLNYLRSKEKRIPKTDYGNDKIKPFFGELMRIDNIVYVTQVSSPKPRHRTMKNSLDFYKLFKGKEFLAVVNLNFMFPVPLSEISNLDYGHIDEYVSFLDENTKSKYIALLKQEMSAIEKLNLSETALKIYSLKYKNPDSPISKRCFDFKQLEEYAKNYKIKI